jgi:hypothetical protein
LLTSWQARELVHAKTAAELKFVMWSGLLGWSFACGAFFYSSYFLAYWQAVEVYMWAFLYCTAVGFYYITMLIGEVTKLSAQTLDYGYLDDRFFLAYHFVSILNLIYLSSRAVHLWVE